jgi:hypothetical protein
MSLKNSNDTIGNFFFLKESLFRPWVYIFFTTNPYHKLRFCCQNVTPKQNSILWRTLQIPSLWNCAHLTMLLNKNYGTCEIIQNNKHEYQETEKDVDMVCCRLKIHGNSTRQMFSRSDITVLQKCLLTISYTCKKRTRDLPIYSVVP